MISEYSDGLQGIVKYNNKVYGLPVDVSPGLFWYRKDLFEQYNIPEIETFGQLRDYGEAVRKDGKYITIITTPAGTWACNIAGMLLQSRGGNIYTEDGKIVGNNEQLEFVLTWINDMMQNDIAADLPHLNPEMWDAMKNGDVIGWIFNISEGANIKKNMPELSGKWSVAPMPK